MSSSRRLGRGGQRTRAPPKPVRDSSRTPRNKEEVMKLIRMLFALGLVVVSAVAAERQRPSVPRRGPTVRRDRALCRRQRRGKDGRRHHDDVLVLGQRPPRVQPRGRRCPQSDSVRWPGQHGSDPSWCECVMPNKTEFQCRSPSVNGKGQRHGRPGRVRWGAHRDSKPRPTPELEAAIRNTLFHYRRTRCDEALSDT